MICRGVPTDKDNYQLINKRNLIHHLMNKGIHPMYINGMDYYFLRTELLDKYVAEYNEKF